MHNTLTIKTNPKSFTDITKDINKIISSGNITVGLCNIFIQHTSCSLIISENYDKDVLFDLETFMSNLVPDKNKYRHDAEGRDDMPSHIRSVLTSSSISIPIKDKKLILGAWQAIYLWEHRDHTYERKIIVSMLNI